MLRKLSVTAVVLTAAAFSMPATAELSQRRMAVAADGNVVTTGAITPVEVIPGAHPLTDTVIRTLESRGTQKDAQDEKEREVLRQFYATRKDAPIWVGPKGWNARGLAAAAEIDNAGAWGLNADAFNLPQIPAERDGGNDLDPETLAAAELDLSIAVLKYARHARGGRIMDPAGQLNSHIDRKPKLIDPAKVIAEISQLSDPDPYLRSLHNTHPQFVKLRAALLANRPVRDGLRRFPANGSELQPGSSGGDVASLRYRLGLRTALPGRLSPTDEFFDDDMKAAVIAFQAERGIAPADGIVNAKTRAALALTDGVDAKRIIANMEQWRWMWENMGDVHLWANVPDFQIRVYKNGELAIKEIIVAGMLDKQTSIFSRPMKSISLRPLWRVPESIKVRELWPSMRRGGGLMRQFGLQMETKDGQPVDWRSINWDTADVRKYEIVQPPGRKSVLGNVKFNFPSQHTIYMHDTPDKWMFKSAQRTLSHGCLRLRNPMRIAEFLLKEDRGWEPDYIAQLIKSGPLNNEVELQKEIPMHITYQTVLVDENGALQQYKDVYGHEKRITQALDGQWTKIAKGRDHLAPVELTSAPSLSTRRSAAKKQPQTTPVSDFISNALGGLF